MSRKRILLFAIGTGVVLGVIFGILHVVFGLSLPPWVIGAVGGAIIVVVLALISRSGGA